MRTGDSCSPNYISSYRQLSLFTRVTASVHSLFCVVILSFSRLSCPARALNCYCWCRRILGCSLLLSLDRLHEPEVVRYNVDVVARRRPRRLHCRMQLHEALSGVILSTANFSAVKGTAGPSAPISWVKHSLAALVHSEASCRTLHAPCAAIACSDGYHSRPLDIAGMPHRRFLISEPTA